MYIFPRKLASFEDEFTEVLPVINVVRPLCKAHSAPPPQILTKLEFSGQIFLETIA